MNRGAAILALVAAFSLAVSSVALAGKPGGNAGGKSSSSLSLVVLSSSGVASATTQPTFGSHVTFNVGTTATTQPYVGVKCFQNGSRVYEQWAGIFADFYGSQTYTLGPTQLWTGGSANCTASLVSFDSRGRATTLASMAFDVAA